MARARTTARKRALNTLYEADEKGEEIVDLLDERLAYPGAQTPLPPYAQEIVRGVASHRRTVDKALEEHSEGWDVKRMHVLDRNIARMAAWEIIYNDDVPAKVAIDEALTLAKAYSDDEAPHFLHGLLSAIERDAEQIRLEEADWEQEQARLAAQKAEEAAETETVETVEEGESTQEADQANRAEQDGQDEPAEEAGELADEEGEPENRN
ncbi:transcription antitermination factor NusB [Parascardovia denticolens]